MVIYQGTCDLLKQKHGSLGIVSPSNKNNDMNLINKEGTSSRQRTELFHDRQPTRVNEKENISDSKGMVIKMDFQRTLGNFKPSLIKTNKTLK